MTRTHREQTTGMLVTILNSRSTGTYFSSVRCGACSATFELYLDKVPGLAWTRIYAKNPTQRAPNPYLRPLAETSEASDISEFSDSCESSLEGASDSSEGLHLSDICEGVDASDSRTYESSGDELRDTPARGAMARTPPLVRALAS